MSQTILVLTMLFGIFGKYNVDNILAEQQKLGFSKFQVRILKILMENKIKFQIQICQMPDVPEGVLDASIAASTCFANSV
jgi:hypothetical protein